MKVEFYKEIEKEKEFLFVKELPLDEIDYYVKELKAKVLSEAKSKIKLTDDKRFKSPTSNEDSRLDGSEVVKIVTIVCNSEKGIDRNMFNFI